MCDYLSNGRHLNKKYIIMFQYMNETVHHKVQIYVHVNETVHHNVLSIIIFNKTSYFMMSKYIYFVISCYGHMFELLLINIFPFVTLCSSMFMKDACLDITFQPQYNTLQYPIIMLIYCYFYY